MPSTPRIAACLVLHGGAPQDLAADLRRLREVFDEVVVYDTAEHLAPGTSAFEAALHPVVTVVRGLWADDPERACAAALSHVRAEWALCLRTGERVDAELDPLRTLLAGAGEAPAVSVIVDDVVRGCHREPRLVRRCGAGAGDADPPEVPGTVLAVRRRVEATVELPAQRRSLGTTV